ncbi:hypothetical protein CPT_Sansa47 [Caulobacter phage Sansa]|uniref:Uncharacterized protein n=1 Tax=Caulobacter phage Sansa TaxID=1675600 RepID=A0A0K1LLS7_9CAUD|nr:hypothetical protein HOR07_gp047 [Caulobacter phage Sansa]AKU43451.1 hypothetical protein CPT_Sansa47 [Caulobacter phage Sansa]
MLWMWGIAGAFVYAVNALILALWNDGSSSLARHRAIAEFAAALITGAIFAEGFASGLQAWVVKLVAVDHRAVALTIGWASNYIWPKLLRKLGEGVDKIPADKMKGPFQ